LDRTQLLRFARQVVLPEVGGKGQERLFAARVLIAGAGGLGSPAAMALAGAGVGTIIIADPDQVERSNLHRQLAYTEADLGRYKAEVLAAAIQDRGCAHAVARCEALNRDNLPELLDQVDLVLDGTDNFETRFALADACVRANRPLVYGAITGFSAQIFLQPAGGAPCLRCLFEAPPADALNCADAGVLPGGTMAVGGLMAQAAMGVVLGSWELPWGSLQVGDLRGMTWRHVRLDARSDCTCAERPT